MTVFNNPTPLSPIRDDLFPAHQAGHPDNRKLPPCDADTVRVVKAMLIDSAATIHCVSYVIWTEEHSEHQRRFASCGRAEQYALQLKCRLEIKALDRDLTILHARSISTPLNNEKLQEAA